MARAKQKIIFLFAFFFAVNFIFAADGIMWGEKNIRVAQTEWFDIIYSKGSAQSAAILAQNADRIYYEIAEMYGTKPQAKMPVVLCPNRQSANAYFSVEFYNHIVIFDTAESEALQIFSEDLLSAFRHELTHAFTYNMKSEGWKGFAKVFGDAVNPAGLFITAGWSEGATLTSESANGEGRLNDEYSKHLAKQAKLEACFPKYDDIQGARDKYPVGAYYIFNGLFNEWLQKKYGMEKYAEFWYKCVNFKTIATRLAFKKVYGIKLPDAWKQFKDELPVPETPPSPMQSQEFDIRDFFNCDKKYSAKNNGGAVFTNLVACDKYIAWFEEKSGSVFIASKDLAEKKKPKIKKLFAIRCIEKISLSQDGRYIAISYASGQSQNYTQRVKIYDLEKKKWIYRNETGVRNAAIIQNNGEHYIVCEKFYSQSKKFAIMPLSQNNKLPQMDLSQVEIPLAINNSASDFVDIGGGNFAFIKRAGITRTLCFANVAGEIIFEAALPYERMILKNLSFDVIANKIYFSYTVPESMPRLGEFDIEEKTFSCDKTDISGGIFFPVKLSENEFVYIGEFYKQNRLFKLKICDNTESIVASDNLSQAGSEIYKDSADALIEKGNVTSDASSPDEILSQSKKYNAFKYFGKGLFLPVGIVPSYSFDPRNNNFLTASYLWFGATYVTNNPWNSNRFIVSAGYSPFTNSGGIMLSASGGTDTTLFKWNVQTQSEFDFGGWKQSSVTGGFSLQALFGKNSAVVLSETAGIFAGRGNDGQTFKWFPTSTNQKELFYARNNTSLYYTNIHQTGEGVFEKGGVSVGTAFLYETAFDITAQKNYSAWAANISPFINVAIPKLIPIKCKDFFVYNLPLSMSVAAFDTTEHFLTASVDAVLFAMDIQKAVPILSAIYFNRFYFSVGYSISTLKEKSSFGILQTANLARDLFSGNVYYTDYIDFAGTIALTPNFGIFANSVFYTEFKFETRYYFNRPQNYNSNWRFLFTLSSNFKL